MSLGHQPNTLLLRGQIGGEYDTKVLPSEIVGDSQILKFFEKMGGDRGKDPRCCLIWERLEREKGTWT